MKRYTPEEKTEILKMVSETSLYQAADHFKISHLTIRRWMDPSFAAKTNAHARTYYKDLTPEERETLNQENNENRKLRRLNDPVYAARNLQKHRDAYHKSTS